MVCLWGVSQPTALNNNREKFKVISDFFPPFLRKTSVVCIQLLEFLDGKGFFSNRNFDG